MHSPSVDPADQAKFEQFAETWWDPHGPFQPLHALNAFRVKWILEHLGGGGSTPLTGLRILDVGCGGGLFSEAMANLGAEVLGVDVTERSIAVANHHRERSGSDVTYRCVSVEELVAEGTEPFDWVVNLEVVEHVADLPSFLDAVSHLVKPGGTQILATINRNPLAGLVAIFAAEQVLKLLPKGTHQYEKLVKPKELYEILKPQGFNDFVDVGVFYNPLTKRASQTFHTLINYMIIASRG